MNTLFDLIRPVPDDRTAIILPDSNIRVSYGAFRDQIQAVAEALAGAGIRRGDRVGIALPNGLPMVVSFFAAAMAGTAAPLNPGYKEDEFRFFLEDTGARVLILPPDGLDRLLLGRYRRAAAREREAGQERDAGCGAKRGEEISGHAGSRDRVSGASRAAPRRATG